MADPVDPSMHRLEQELDDLRAKIVKLQDQIDSCRATIVSVLHQVPESFLPTDVAMDDDDLIER